MTMKKTYCIMAAALLLTGALMTTACSSEDEAIESTPEPQPAEATAIQFTATLSPKGDDGGTTRAISTGTDANSKEILNVA